MLVFKDHKVGEIVTAAPPPAPEGPLRLAQRSMCYSSASDKMPSTAIMIPPPLA